MSAPRGLYTPVYGSLKRHPKTVRAAAALGISRFELIGHLVSLWTWCLDSVGIEHVIPANVVAAGAEWPEERADEFAEALADAGLLDRVPGGFQVHEWKEYGGKVAERQRYDRERKRGGSSRSVGTSAEVPWKGGGISTGLPSEFQRDSSVDETRRDQINKEEEAMRVRAIEPAKAPIYDGLVAIGRDFAGSEPHSWRVLEELAAAVEVLKLEDVSQIRGEVRDAVESGHATRGRWSFILAIVGRVAADRRRGCDPWSARGAVALGAGGSGALRGRGARAWPGALTGAGRADGRSAVPARIPKREPDQLTDEQWAELEQAREHERERQRAGERRADGQHA